MEATATDSESIVGDECHIVARSPDGPRAGEIAEDSVDECSNLILLCKVDHKRVDDQQNYFHLERLRAIKTAHEVWVHTSLSAQVRPSFQYRIGKGPNDEQFRLILMKSARDLINVVTGCDEGDFDHDELENELEVETVADFLQELHDLEMYDDVESGERVRTRFRLSQGLTDLTQSGFVVYGGKLRRVLEIRDERFPWLISVIRVLRTSNPFIH
jgi:hypothetical protein